MKKKFFKLVNEILNFVDSLDCLSNDEYTVQVSYSSECCNLNFFFDKDRVTYHSARPFELHRLLSSYLEMKGIKCRSEVPEGYRNHVIFWFQEYDEVRG